MARFRFNVNDKRSTGASRTQQQEQEQQQKEGHQRQLQAHSECDNNKCWRCPMLPPVLALPAFEDSSSEDNREELQEERNRLIQRYAGGELQFLIDWFEHIHRDLEELRRDLDSVKEELWRKRSG
ncbi:PREDICTED: uncharacterized protein LOC105119537 [Populus euphratica]|uniref:Uncharacterized protein LOC105119537 n=1 Tax=Populus euphratica TaxID=75702 RepID=A0AAJ6XET4_POPEU|nr:PREDICTED: uncharacterized protein LOC105119537 [Populus euphratica]